MPPELWIEAAGEKGGRGAREALRDKDVHEDVKMALKMMSIVSARIPGTPAERDRQQKQLTWQGFAHGMAVEFGTPNIETKYNRVFAAIAQSPGVGSLTDEWGPGQPLVCLGDLDPRYQKNWLDWHGARNVSDSYFAMWETLLTNSQLFPLESGKE